MNFNGVHLLNPREICVYMDVHKCFPTFKLENITIISLLFRNGMTTICVGTNRSTVV